MTPPRFRRPPRPDGLRCLPPFDGPERPTQLGRMMELAKMAWSPVLELLSNEVRFGPHDRRPFRLRARSMRVPEPVHGGPVLHWLSVDEVLRIHDEMVQTFGGELGGSDPGMVERVLFRMRESPGPGHHRGPTIFDRAAILMHSLLRAPPFLDGQKRTGVSAAFIFLGINGHYLWSRDALDEVQFTVQVAQGGVDVPEVSRWIRERVASREAIQGPIFVDQLLRLGSPTARRRCSVCRARYRPNRYRVQCPTCGTRYQVRLNAALVSPPSLRYPAPVVMIQPGVQILGSSESRAPSAPDRTESVRPSDR